MDNYEKESELYIKLQTAFITKNAKESNNRYTVNCMGKSASQIRETNRALIKQLAIKEGVATLTEKVPEAAAYLYY